MKLTKEMLDEVAKALSEYCMPIKDINIYYDPNKNVVYSQYWAMSLEMFEQNFPELHEQLFEKGKTKKAMKKPIKRSGK